MMLHNVCWKRGFLKTIVTYLKVIKMNANAFRLLFDNLDNYIDGREFLLLTEDEVKYMIPPIGLAKKIARLLPSSKVFIILWHSHIYVCIFIVNIDSSTSKINNSRL